MIERLFKVRQRVGVGARTGLANVVTAACLLATLFVTPWVAVIGQASVVTAPALILVGLLMLKAAEGIPVERHAEAAPANAVAPLFVLRYALLPA